VFHNQKGAAALLLVVIVGSVALVMAYGVSLFGLGELEISYTSQQGGESFSIANGCMDEALRQLRLSDAYTGGSLSVGDGSCTIGVDAGSGHTISVTSTLGNYTQVLQTTVTTGTGGAVTVTSWEEL
jgi:hypothetical protein